MTAGDRVTLRAAPPTDAPALHALIASNPGDFVSFGFSIVLHLWVKEAEAGDRVAVAAAGHCA